MAKDFSAAFYNSQEWLNCRDSIYKRDKGLCQDCLLHSRITSGEEVHHIIWLTPKNITEPSITLNPSNLVLLCRECHRARHKTNTNYRKGRYKINADGSVVVE